MTFASTVLVLALAFVKAGRLRGITVTSPQRASTLPDAATIAQTMPGYDVSPWYGVVATAGTPMAIVQKLHGEIVRIVAAPDVARRLTGNGGRVANSTLDDFTAMLRAQRAKWAREVKKSGIKAE